MSLRGALEGPIYLARPSGVRRGRPSGPWCRMGVVSPGNYLRGASVDPAYLAGPTRSEEGPS